VFRLFFQSIFIPLFLLPNCLLYVSKTPHISLLLWCHVLCYATVVSCLFFTHYVTRTMTTATLLYRRFHISKDVPWTNYKPYKPCTDTVHVNNWLHYIVAIIHHWHFISLTNHFVVYIHNTGLFPWIHINN